MIRGSVSTFAEFSAVFRDSWHAQRGWMQAVGARQKKKITERAVVVRLWSFCFSYLPKVPDVKKVKSIEKIAFLHSKYLVARCQESPDVLQAQELHWDDRKGFFSQ